MKRQEALSLLFGPSACCHALVAVSVPEHSGVGPPASLRSSLLQLAGPSTPLGALQGLSVPLGALLGVFSESRAN